MSQQYKKTCQKHFKNTKNLGSKKRSQNQFNYDVGYPKKDKLPSPLKLLPSIVDAFHLVAITIQQQFAKEKNIKNTNVKAIIFYIKQ
jgi:hypothetical protein